MRLRYLVAVIGMFAFSLAAKADALYDYTFNFNGGIVSGYAVTAGTLVFEGTKNVGINNVTYVSGELSGFIPTKGTVSINSNFLMLDTNTDFNLPVGSVGEAIAYFTPSGSSYAVYQVSPGVVTRTGVGLTYGSLGGSVSITPVSAATPEPSSLALLGTGLLGLAGAVRRRIA